MPPTQTPEQRIAAYTAAGLNPPSIPPTGATPSTITSNALASNPAPNVTLPPPTPIPDISNIPTTPTTPSTPAPVTNDFNTKLEELTNRLAGRPIQEATAIGTATAPYEQQLNELNKQIKANQLQALTFKNQAEKNNVLAPFAQGDIERANRANAIESLRLSSLKEATQGDIAFAQKQAQLAVATEFAPIERDLITARQNIINNYDSMTPAQKKRADITLATLNEKDAFVARQKSDREEAFKVATTAAANSSGFRPTAEYPTVNSALQAIQNSDPQKALQISTQTGLTKPLTGQSDFEQAFLRDKGRLPTVAELLNFKQKEAAIRNVSIVNTAGLPNNFVNAVQTGKTGTDLLNSLSPLDRASLQSILNYEKNPANLSLRKTKGEAQSEREKFLSMAHLIDPTYDETQYSIRSAVKKDFTSGKSAQNIRSLNTAVGHLDTLAKAGDALQNASIPLWNKIVNFGITAVGDKRVVAFNTAATAVESELASVFKGMGATDQEIKTWRENINSSQSPDQIKGAIDQAIQLMSSRLQALTNQYEVGIGKPKDFEILSNKSRQILSGLGVDVNAIDPKNQINQSINQNFGILLSPDGKQQVKVSDLTPAQIQEAKNAGWK